MPTDTNRRPPRSIAIDARHLQSSTGTYMDRLLAHLQDVDTENRYTVILLEKDAKAWTPDAPNFTVEAVPYACYSFGEQLGFNRYLSRRDFDLVHFCMPQQPVAYRGKSVTTFHDLTLLKTYNSQKNWLIYHAKQLVAQGAFRIAASKSSLVIVPSDFTKMEMHAMLSTPLHKMVVTHEAAESRSSQSEPLRLGAGRFLLYVGQQSDYKNLKRLAEAHQDLRKSRPDLKLVLAGRLDSAAERNRAEFARRGFEGIHFTGYVSDGELRWLYENATAYVFPSLMEGFGLPGLEAMLHGLPVVSSNATCLPEVYGHAAEFFEPTDVGSMVTAIARVIDDPARREQLRGDGASQVLKYSWRRMAEQTHEVYLSVLENRPALDRGTVQAHA